MKIISTLDYAKKLDRLKWFTDKIRLDSYFTITEYRELENLQKAIGDYESEHFNNGIPAPIDFLKKFMEENELSIYNLKDAGFRYWYSFIDIYKTNKVLSSHIINFLTNKFGIPKSILTNSGMSRKNYVNNR